MKASRISLALKVNCICHYNKGKYALVEFNVSNLECLTCPKANWYYVDFQHCSEQEDLTPW